MNYKFPQISQLSDVLPHIEGRDEFIVAERKGHKIVNYVVSKEDSFDDPVRRECRGLVFGAKDEIISRPFHKFFNVNEKEETQEKQINLSLPHAITEKVDGSMIRPLIFNGGFRLATKMGVTDVANNAERWLFSRPDVQRKQHYMIHLFNKGLTPIFEWISPKNRIVVRHKEENLILLAIRDNVSGVYLPLDSDAPFDLVPVYGDISSIDDYIAKVRGQEEREGDVIHFSDGHKVKIKTDWYVRIHKILDKVKFERNIVDLILNDELDDAIAGLPESERERIKNYEKKFWQKFNQKIEDLKLIYEKSQKYETRKEIALNYANDLEKSDKSLLFKMLDGRDVHSLLLKHIQNNTSTNAKWEICESWLNIS